MEELSRSLLPNLLPLRDRLLKGRNLGIDSSVIESNAFWGVVNRNTGEQYWEYVNLEATVICDSVGNRR